MEKGGGCLKLSIRAKESYLCLVPCLFLFSFIPKFLCDTSILQVIIAEEVYFSLSNLLVLNVSIPTFPCPIGTCMVEDLLIFAMGFILSDHS